MWRYFESVPEEMSTMRTLEAAAAADRHLRYIQSPFLPRDGPMRHDDVSQ